MRRAFSLVEILVTIGIIAVLIAILIPALAGTKESASELKSLANLHSIGQTLTHYNAVFNDEYPYYAGGEQLPIAPESDSSRPYATFVPAWLFASHWTAHPGIHDVAPWPEHYETWLSPGAEADSELPAWRMHDGEAIVFRPPSYHYSNTFIGDPRVWSDDPPAWEDALRTSRVSDVRHPSAKVVMWDNDRPYLLPEAQPDDRRPVLLVDSSASLRLDADATPSARNAYWGMRMVYNDTPNGVHGRDF